MATQRSVEAGFIIHMATQRPVRSRILLFAKLVKKQQHIPISRLPAIKFGIMASQHHCHAWALRMDVRKFFFRKILGETRGLKKPSQQKNCTPNVQAQSKMRARQWLNSILNAPDSHEHQFCVGLFGSVLVCFGLFWSVFSHIFYLPSVSSGWSQ